MKKLSSLCILTFLVILLSGCMSNKNSVTDSEETLVITRDNEIDYTTKNYLVTPIDSDEKNFDCLLWEENDGTQSCMQSWYLNTYSFTTLWLQLERRDTNKLGENYYMLSGNKIYANNPNNSEDIGIEQILVYSSLEEVQNVLPISWCTIILSSYTGDNIEWLQTYEISNDSTDSLCNTQNKEFVYSKIYKNLNNGLFYLFEGFDWCAPWSCDSYDIFKGI